MSRRYTAQEMRKLAETIDHGGAFALTDPSIVESNVAMLRQAADDLDRKKEYEYRIDYIRQADGNVCSNYSHFDSLKQAKRYATPLPDEEVRFVRREVGEWEEVDGNANDR